MVQRFAGEICGFGTASGVRVVIGRWTRSPIGPFADAMVEHPGGDRVLIAPSVEVAELIGGLYAFDDTTITDVGTASGIRVVIGRWARSPIGSFADAMVEHPGGDRVLLAPSVEVAELIGGLYAFDATTITDVVTERAPGCLRFNGGPLSADVTIGGRDALGWVLRCIPRALATSVWWARIVDPVARVTMRGVRTTGRTAGGRETYGATDRHRVTAVQARWAGEDLGPLADVDPPVRFGFSSTPTRPSIVSVTTTIRPP